MNANNDKPPEKTFAELSEEVKEHFAAEEKQLHEVDEAIEKAKQKSKNVIRNPDP